MMNDPGNTLSGRVVIKGVQMHPSKKWKNSDYIQIFTIFAPHDSTLYTIKQAHPSSNLL
jgi:hypothetical protein